MFEVAGIHVLLVIHLFWDAERRMHAIIGDMWVIAAGFLSADPAVAGGISPSPGLPFTITSSSTQGLLTSTSFSTPFIRSLTTTSLTAATSSFTTDTNGLVTASTTSTLEVLSTTLSEPVVLPAGTGPALSR